MITLSTFHQIEQNDLQFFFSAVCTHIRCSVQKIRNFEELFTDKDDNSGKGVTLTLSLFFAASNLALIFPQIGLFSCLTLYFLWAINLM